MFSLKNTFKAICKFNELQSAPPGPPLSPVFHLAWIPRASPFYLECQVLAKEKFRFPNACSARKEWCYLALERKKARMLDWPVPFKVLLRGFCWHTRLSDLFLVPHPLGPVHVFSLSMKGGASNMFCSRKATLFEAIGLEETVRVAAFALLLPGFCTCQVSWVENFASGWWAFVPSG